MENRDLPDHSSSKVVIKTKDSVLIWKIWGPERADEPEKKVNKRRITQLKQRKYKATRITTTLKVINGWKSTRIVEFQITPKGKHIHQLPVMVL